VTATPPLAQRIVERVGRSYAIEAVRMLEAGEGTVAGIDAALRATGHRAGAFLRLDEVGLDIDLALDRALSEADPRTSRFDAPALQVHLVAQGRLGRAAGRGFYRYHGADAVPDVEAPDGAPLRPPEIVERIELAMVNEAYRAVEDGLAAPPTIDTVMREAGSPRGPFEIVDGLGLREVIDRLRTLEAMTAPRSGDQYRVATLLWQMATV
jgi:3-hydroxyacyl-CoA dehydrogenase